MSPRGCKEALIFDYDGVLADTETLHWRSWTKILEPLGVSFTWKQYCEVGRGVHDACMIETLRLRAQDPSVFTGLENKNDRRKAIMRELCAKEPPICQETIKMLLSLKDYKLGVVTSSARSDVEPVLHAAGILQCFDTLVFGEHVERHKPAADPYLLMRIKLGIKSGLVFEDSEAGIVSAKKAGFAVIPVADPQQLSSIVYQALAGR